MSRREAEIGYGGQRGNRTPDTRIFNGVLQIFLNIFSWLQE